MRVLFLHSGTEDYLAQSLFHGLRSLLGNDCVDVPRFDLMYRDYGEEKVKDLRGHGFSLYGLLPEVPEIASSRNDWQKHLSEFDIIVVGNIWRQWKETRQRSLLAARQKIVVLDGEDSPTVFPYRRKIFFESPSVFARRRLGKYYYKREWCDKGSEYGSFARLLPRWIRRFLPSASGIQPISFSFPKEKIADFSKLAKTKSFPGHIVDQDILSLESDSHYPAKGSIEYAFFTEGDYYADLQSSKFGITTKRAGWDCLRHYEMAANGCVLCFRNLHLKPSRCAPFGLNSTNSISYRNANDLMSKLRSLTADEYDTLLYNTHSWIQENTTEQVAGRFLASAV